MSESSKRKTESSKRKTESSKRKTKTSNRIKKQSRQHKTRIPTANQSLRNQYINQTDHKLKDYGPIVHWPFRLKKPLRPKKSVTVHRKH